MTGNTTGIKVMRLSLRTLLAFEDNIFDVEQHRQLERIIPKHDAAAMMLGRIRRVVRNPRLGVPGLVDQREELEPNVVAEYLDHQMSDDSQQRFEAYCLSSDKYLAETASVHQILSNVLGEPARTSRECRLRCYNLYGAAPDVPALREQTFEEKLNRLTENIGMTRKSPEPAPEPEPSFDAFLRLYPHSPQQASSSARDLENFVDAAPKPVVSERVPERRSADGPAAEPVPVAAKSDNVSDKDSNSLLVRIVRFFAPQEEPERKGFSLWMLLLIFLLGFGLLFGWKAIGEGREKAPGRQVSRTVRHPMDGPPIPLEPPVAASLVVPPVPPVQEMRPETPTPVVVEPKPKTAANKTPAKKTPAVKAPVVPEAEVVDAAAKQTSPPSLPTPPAPKPEEVKPVAERPKPPVEPIRSPSPPPLPALPTVAVVKTDTPPPNRSVSGPPSDPFLSAVAEPVAASEPVKTVGWNVHEATPVKAEEKKEIETPLAVSSSMENTFFQTKALTPSEPTPLPEWTSNVSATELSTAAPSATSPSTERNLIETPSIPPAEPPAPPQPKNVIKPVEPPAEPPVETLAETLEGESIIAFQPISAPPQRRSTDPVVPETPPSPPVPLVFSDAAPEANRPTPEKLKPAKSDAVPGMAFREVVHPVAMARQFGEVVTTAQVLEKGRKTVGRVLPLPEPGFIFSAPSAGDQWALKTLPQELYVDQYLLTVTPFRIDLDLGGAFQVEMVGDAKICILPPDENGVPGIFVDYGRLVIRPIPTSEGGRSLRIRTEHVSGSLEMTGPNSLAFVDTFAEVLSEAGTEIRVPKASPIIGFLPAAQESIRWQTEDRGKPLVTDRMASVLLKPGPAGFGSIQGRPNWLQRLPLPVEGRQLAEVCTRIFTQHGHDSEAALHALILQESVHIRFFGYRLWGDLGRFDVPLSLMAEADPNQEAIRQVLVPYFREVMKRDEETVQRLADAIEAVRR